MVAAINWIGALPSLFWFSGFFSNHRWRLINRREANSTIFLLMARLFQCLCLPSSLLSLYWQPAPLTHSSPLLLVLLTLETIPNNSANLARSRDVGGIVPEHAIANSWQNNAPDCPGKNALLSRRITLPFLPFKNLRIFGPRWRETMMGWAIRATKKEKQNV